MDKERREYKMRDKNFLSFDGTKDVVFFKCAIRSVSEETQKKHDELGEGIDEQQQKASIPKIFSILQIVFLLVGIVLVTACIRACGNVDESPIEFVVRTWWLWLLGIASLIIAFVIEKAKRNKIKEVSESADFKAISEESELICQQAFNELKVPDNAVPTDLFLTTFKLNGKGKRVSANVLEPCDSNNVEFRLFIENDNLCVADVSMVSAIPLASLTGIEKVKKNMVFDGWNKAEPYNSDKYKKYKVQRSQYGAFFVKPYYILKFNVDGSEYGLYFPPYELDTILSLTGLSNPDMEIIVEDKSE